MLLANFQKNAATLFTATDNLLIGVSGGLDSVVLCHLCKAAGYRFAIAHCNFSLRNDESDDDARFTQQLAADLEVPFHHIIFDTHHYALENKLSIQLAARELRYNWFQKLLTQGNYRYLLTAHHLNDNTETVLMHLFKGTGILGLKGIPASNDYIRRPLLPFTRTEIHNYAINNQITWREDSSNSNSKYERNFMRLQIIPLIEQRYPQLQENMLHNIERFHDIAWIYQQQIEKRKKQLFIPKKNEWHIPIALLLKQKAAKTILYELLHPFGFTGHQLDDILQIARSENGKYVATSTHRIIKYQHWLILAGTDNTTQSSALVIEAPGSYVYPEGVIHISDQNDPSRRTALKQAERIALKELSFPLILRPWKTGDYFYPLGLGKKKKLSRFFIDNKLSMTQKEKVWVLESKGRICWVIGYRIDHRFRIQQDTAEIAYLHTETSDTAV